MTERRYPLHLAVLVGASTAAYAVSMAGVTALQSNADLALAQRQAPAAEAAARITAGHDRLEADLERAAKAYAASAASYDELTAGLTSLEKSLEAYSGRMSRVTGASMALPGRVSLPSVSRSSSSTSSKPKVSSTTSASGKV